MTDFGTSVTNRVNATYYKIQITYASISSYFLLLQDVRTSVAGTEYREPTTSGGPVYYSGQPNDRLQGTILYSTDMWNSASSNFIILTTRVNGEKPIFKLIASTLDVAGNSTTFTWDPANGNFGAKIETLSVDKSPEGGVKVSISIALIGDPVISTSVVPSPTLTLNSINTTASLSWTSVSGATSYSLYQSINGGSYSLLESGLSTSYTTATLTNGDTYSYYVTATTSAGTSLASNTVGGTAT